MSYTYKGTYTIKVTASPSSNNHATGTTCNCSYSVGSHPDGITVTSVDYSISGSNNYYNSGYMEFRNSSGTAMGRWSWSGSTSGSKSGTLTDLNSAAVLACTSSGKIYAQKGTTGNAIQWSSAGKTINLTVHYSRVFYESSISVNSDSMAFGEVPSATITKHTSMDTSRFNALTHYVYWKVSSTYSDSNSDTAPAHGNKRVTVANGNTTATRASAIPYEWIKSIPEATSCTCTVTCETYYGTNSCGSKTATFTLNVPTSVIPTIDSLTYAVTNDGGDGYSFYQQHNKILQNMVGVVVTGNNVSGAYDSTIKKYDYVLDEENIHNDNVITIDRISQSGNVQIKMRVQDSRSRWSEYAVCTIPVEAYSPPTFIDHTAYRSDNLMNAESSGMWATIQAYTSFYPLSFSGFTNTVTISTTYYSTDNLSHITGTYAGIADMADGVKYVIGDTNGDGIGDMDIDHTWYIVFKIQDGVTSETVEMRVVTAPFAIHIKNGGLGVAFGKIAEFDGRVEINEDWELYTHGMSLENYILYVVQNSVSNIVDAAVYYQKDEVIGMRANMSYSSSWFYYNSSGSYALVSFLLPRKFHNLPNFDASTSGNWKLRFSNGTVLNVSAMEFSIATDGMLTGLARVASSSITSSQPCILYNTSATTLTVT